MRADEQTSRNNLLIISGKTGKVEKLREMLALGVDIDVSDGQGTALMYAAFRGHLDYIKAIVALGANVSLRGGGGKTALEWAEQAGHEDIVSFLSAHSGEQGEALPELAETPDSGWGVTALHRAIASRKRREVERLLAKGVEIDAITRFGFTPLMLAAYLCEAPIVGRLLQAGARLPVDPVLLPGKGALEESGVADRIDQFNGLSFAELWERRQRADRRRLRMDQIQRHPFWEICADEDDDTHMLRPVVFLEPLDHDVIGFVVVEATLADGSILPGYARFDGFTSERFTLDAKPTLWTGLEWVDFDFGRQKPSRDQIEQVYRTLNRPADAVFPVRIRSTVALKDQPSEGAVEGFTWVDSRADGTEQVRTER